MKRISIGRCVRGGTGTGYGGKGYLRGIEGDRVAVIGGKGGLAGHFSTAKEFLLLLGFFIDSLLSYHHHK